MATIATRKMLELGASQSFEEYEVTASLTSADILDIANTPITLAPGVAGKTFLPTAAWVVYHFNTTAYAPFDIASDLLIGNGVGSMFALSQTGLIDVDWDVFGIFATLIVGVGAVFAAGDVSGQAFFLQTASPAPTLGDGTIDVTVLYRTVDL